MFLRHANGVKLNRVKFKLESADFRPALVCQDVEKLQCSGWTIPSATGADAIVRLESTRDASLRGFVLDGTGAAALVQVEGSESGGILIDTNPAGISGKPVQFGEGAQTSSVQIKD